MLSRIAKVSLVATSLAPIFLTLWFIYFSVSWNWEDGLSYFIVAVSLAVICRALLFLSQKRLEKVPVKIILVKTADKEIVVFILVYLLPLINRTDFNINGVILAFVAALFFLVVLTTNSYHFNPLVGFFGYHFYEVTIEGGITYVLITRKNINNCKNVKSVVQVSEYMILET